MKKKEKNKEEKLKKENCCAFVQINKFKPQNIEKDRKP